MALTSQKLLAIARDFLDGNLTPKEIRTSEERVRGNEVRAVVALVVFASQRTTRFERKTTSLNHAVSALFPIVFKDDGRLFNSEFDMHVWAEDEWQVDSRGYLSRAKFRL